MISLTLVDLQNSKTWELLEVPFTEQPVEGVSDVQTLSGNVYTDFLYQKRIWKHKWAYMTEQEYLELRAFYDRQFTDYKYPLVTIPDLGVENVPVRMSINNRNIVNNCGVVSGVEITLRETAQINAGS
jgi:hypothetical protein